MTSCSTCWAIDVSDWRGPAPKLADREVITMERVGEYISLHQDQALFAYFQRPYAHVFPVPRQLHCTTFVRQAAHLCHLKERIGQRLLTQIHFDPSLHLVDTCLSVRMYLTRPALPRGGCLRQRRPVAPDLLRFSFPCPGGVAGVIVRFSLAPATGHETTVVPELVEGQRGTLLGDRHYGSLPLQEELASQGRDRPAPFPKAGREPWPRHSALLHRFRYQIDTVFGPRVDRYFIQRV